MICLKEAFMYHIGIMMAFEETKNGNCLNNYN